MEWLVLGLSLAALAAVSFYVWRRWIAPWREVERLAEAIVEDRTPSGFLTSGNQAARQIGFSLEKLATRLRDLEERLHEGEFSVQAVFGAMLDGLVAVDDRRIVRMMNREFRRVFGLGEIGPGRPLIEMIRHASVDRLVTETIRTGEPRRESIQMSRGPSEGRELEVSAVPLGDSEQAGGAVVLFRDVTQLRRAEEMRRDFIANVSHELRTPLAIFRGYLETLLDDPKQPPGELLRILEVMERHSDRLNALVEDVLSLARLESPKTELELTEIRLPEFLESILRDWGKRFGEKQLRPQLEAAADLPVLEADEHLLQEVIYNLLDNAVKYSPKEGAISIKAIQRGDRIRVSVADEGIGIPESDLPRIFERFYRADKARSRELGGTGLGLSIVKHVVHRHGGNVEADSSPGHGTTISVTLPIQPA